MIDNPTDKPEPASEPTTEASSGPERLVGPVNATFEPAPPAAPTVAEPEEVQPAPAPEEPAAVADDGAAPPPLETTPASSGNSSLLGCLRDILLVLVSIILGAAFALVILLGINGTLFLNDSEKTSYLEVTFNAMQSRQDALEAEQSAQKSALATTEAKLNDMESQMQDLDAKVNTLDEAQQKQAGEIDGLQARTDEVEQAVEVNRQEMKAVQDRQKLLTGQVIGLKDQIGDVEDQVDQMEDDIADVKETADRFNRFVEGLVRLMAEVTAEELQSSNAVTETTSIATPAITPTAETSEPESTPAPSTTPTAPAGQSSALELFPPRYALPTPEPGAGVIYGLVWQDANANGQPDAGEVSIPGVPVLLKDADGRALLNMVTGVDGRYVFINIPPGKYQLLARPPENRGYALPAVQTVTVAPDQSVEINFGLTIP